MSVWTKEFFLEKAHEIHNNKYDYLNVNFVNSHIKVKILCTKHGEFEQTPSNHIMGKGCSYCGGVGRLTHDIFLERAKKIHGTLYEYILPEKITNITKIDIKCEIHGIFKQTPKNHLKGQKCPKCNIYNGYTQTDFINMCKEVHKDKYDYSKSVYVKCTDKIIIICKEHGEFEQIASNHYKGMGCYKCQNLTRTTEDFIIKANKIHSDLFDYSKVKYISAKEKVIIICKVHGEFKQSPNEHLDGCGCNKCSVYGYSKACLRWINNVEKKLGYKIQHAGNKGEKKVKIDNKLFKFDGYDKKTNTVYEFYGSFWHGDQRIYNPNDFNPINKKTFGELYKDTLEREKIIIASGYNLVVMWEKDFK